MKIVWLGFLVPPDMSERLARRDRYITAQTQIFQARVVRAIENEPGAEVALVSAPPITDWSSVRVTELRRWAHRAGAMDWVVPSLNFLGLKQVCVFLGSLLGALGHGLLVRPRPRAIVTGASYFPHLLATWCAARLLGVGAYAFITDMPGLLAVADPWYKRWLRPLDIGVVRACLRRMDGLVVLSEHSIHDFFPGSRFLVLPGLAEPARPTLPVAAPSPGRDFIIMYTGALMEEYGLGLLLAAFEQIPAGRARLWITGRGDYEPAVRAAAARRSDIEFLGYVSAVELEQRLAQATVLVSLRLSHQGHARYSFPSKLIEYMTKPCFVVTNRFPSLPADYARHLIILEEESAPALAALLEDIRAGRCGDRRAFAERMQAFVSSRASLEAEGDRLRIFLGGRN